ncbi:MAG: hypothetical protein KJ755_20550, partial [Alphaproteobacteria bacterium]|nr:hypothetical protein [Alphaproteobacteria bacterium]
MGIAHEIPDRHGINPGRKVPDKLAERCPAHLRSTGYATQSIGRMAAFWRMAGSDRRDDRPLKRFTNGDAAGDQHPRRRWPRNMYWRAALLRRRNGCINPLASFFR